MKRVFPRFAPYAFALLRIMAGIMFMMHGTQKFFGWPGGKETVELMSLRGLAGFIELVGGGLIAIGLFAGIAAFIASGEMAVAFFMVHAPQGLNPLLNEGELAALYCFVFFYIAMHGSGIWSVDAATGSRRTETVAGVEPGT